MERLIERFLFAGRWLMAPLYVGLVVLLLFFVAEFYAELGHFVVALLSGERVDLIGVALTLVDLVLVASLIIMVTLSGFENFVSKITLSAAEERLGWLMKFDVGSLKVKMAASIAMISAIDLLKVFLDIKEVPSDKLWWLIVIPLALVATALALAALDRLASASPEH